MNLPNSPEPTPDPKKKKLTPKIIAGATVATIISIATVLEKKIVIGFLDTSVQWLKAVNQSDIGQPRIHETPSVSGKNSQLDLLSTLSVNRVYHDCSANVASVLILSESAQAQLTKLNLTTVSVNIEFPSKQDSVAFWIIDKQNHKESVQLKKKNGSVNPRHQNEYSFDIALGSLPKINKESVSEIRIESNELKGLKNHSCSFAVNSLVIK